MSNDIEKFLEEHWDNCICNMKNDEGPNIGLPFPYSVPTETDTFRNMFYWDTYFTNIGLIYSGRIQQAKNNTDDILYLVDKFGFMPNTNNINALRCSQPPVLSLMVRDVFEVTGDCEWLKKAYTTLEKEYSFWMTERIAPNGLNRYGFNASKMRNHRGTAEYYYNRTGLEPDFSDVERRAENVIAEGESGWDYNPRFNGECTDFIPVDLNALLYAFEKNMQYFSSTIFLLQDGIWSMRAEKRKKALRGFLWNEEKSAFYDRNYKNGEWSRVFAASAYFALMCGAVSDDEAEKMLEKLPLVELDSGVACCEKNDIPGSYQWGYPNCWAPVQFGVIKGLQRYGFLQAAERVAEKFLLTVEKCFAETGNLWEKYNAADGSINVTNEYEMPPMLGWTAGVYLYCLRGCVAGSRGNYMPEKKLVNGVVWYDTDGNPISAHGGCIIKVGNVYYWYGECRKGDCFVNCYSSRDLHNWKFENTVLSVGSPAKPSDLSEVKSLCENGVKCNIERPKVIYNRKTGEYVMWMHYEDGKSYAKAMTAVATCTEPDGDFVFRGAFNPLGFMSRDLTVYCENDRAYLISASNNNRDLHIYELSDDFLSVKRLCSKQFLGLYREAPAVFKKNGVYYMLTSYCTGWAPNQAKISFSNSIEEGWSELVDIDDYTTHKSQPAFILTLEENGITRYFYVGDRWGGTYWKSTGFCYDDSTVVIWPIEFGSSGQPYLGIEESF